MSTKLSGRGGQVAELEVLHQSNKIEGAAGTLVAEKDTIIRTLRTQLEAANTAFVSRDEECRRLSSAVAAREQEIARSSKLISSGAASRAGASDASSGLQLSGNMADQYVAADTANKRIIDQLNGQVDFLNNELAKREAQLVDVNDKLLQYDALRAELMHRYSFALLLLSAGFLILPFVLYCSCRCLPGMHCWTRRARMPARPARECAR